METQSRSSEFWELALAINAAFKGLLAASGQSGHICKIASPVSLEIDTSNGWSSVMECIVSRLAGLPAHGDTVVVADKVVAAALGRIGPREILLEPDPKTVDAEFLEDIAAAWQEKLGFRVSPFHLLLADEFGDTAATLGADDHNLRCSELAAAIYAGTGTRVDVVISDTDTGLDTRSPLIGTVTIAATPLGATKGLNLYEAMRCAVAAEFVRGHDRGIPVVLCMPAERRRNRKEIGLPRGYPGHLHISNESGITYV